MICRIRADEFGGGFLVKRYFALEDEAAILISLFDFVGFFVHILIQKLCVEHDVMVDELLVMIDEFAREESFTVYPGQEDFIAWPEVEVQELIIVDPF